MSSDAVKIRRIDRRSIRGQLQEIIRVLSYWRAWLGRVFSFRSSPPPRLVAVHHLPTTPRPIRREEEDDDRIVWNL